MEHTSSNQGLCPEREGFLRATIRAAFRPVRLPPAPQYVHKGRVQASVPNWGGDSNFIPCIRLVVIVPTLADRCSVDQLWPVLRRLERSLARASGEGPLLCGLIVAMQARAGGAASEMAERLMALENRWMGACKFAFLGVRLEQPSKILALNHCRAAAAAFEADMVAWFDDDVFVDEDCVRALVARFDPAHPGIYGGRKRAVADGSAFSARWADHKNRIEPVNAYPHGCAILLSNRLFQKGIPLDYQSDDSFFLLEHLDLDAAANPLWRLVVVEEAEVRVPSTNDVTSTCRRIARNYRNGLRILVDASPATAHHFLRRILFSGLRAPQTVGELASPPYWRALGWHSLKFLFWAGVASEVVVRAVTGRPRDVEWFVAPFPGGH